MTTTIDLTFTPDELNLVLTALGRLPYVQVHELIASIQAKAGPQLLAARHAQAGEAPRNRGSLEEG